MLESADEGGQIRLVEERLTAEGVSVVYAIAAEVDRGQIVRETAVMSGHRSPSDRASSHARRRPRQRSQ